MSRFWVTDLQSQRGVKQQGVHPHDANGGEADDEQAQVRKLQAGEHVPAPHQPAGASHVHVVGAEGLPHQLLEEQADAPGGEQRFERPSVEAADQRAFEQQTRQSGHNESQRQGQDKVPAEILRGELLRKIVLKNVK